MVKKFFEVTFLTLMWQVPDKNLMCVRIARQRIHAISATGTTCATKISAFFVSGSTADTFPTWLVSVATCPHV